MRTRLVQLVGAVLLAASLGCAPMGLLRLGEDSYAFDSAVFATKDDWTVLALSTKAQKAWELVGTPRNVWIVFPGEPVEGTYEIERAACSLRYAGNLGLALGMLCAAQTQAGRGDCEIPEHFGEWAESGSVTVERFVARDRLEGRFEVAISSGELSGDFNALFDPLAALKLDRLLPPTP